MLEAVAELAVGLVLEHVLDDPVLQGPSGSVLSALGLSVKQELLLTFVQNLQLVELLLSALELLGCVFQRLTLLL